MLERDVPIREYSLPHPLLRPSLLSFTRLVEKIVLIDGLRLADLMMEYGVGVSHRIVRIPKIDSDYFEE